MLIIITNSQDKEAAPPEDTASISSPTVVSSEDTSKYITVREETEQYFECKSMSPVIIIN